MCEKSESIRKKEARSNACETKLREEILRETRRKSLVGILTVSFDKDQSTMGEFEEGEGRELRSAAEKRTKLLRRAVKTRRG